jgi:hypothetical protein
MVSEGTDGDSRAVLLPTATLKIDPDHEGARRESGPLAKIHKKITYGA